MIAIGRKMGRRMIASQHMYHLPLNVSVTGFMQSMNVFFIWVHQIRLIYLSKTLITSSFSMSPYCPPGHLNVSVHSLYRPQWLLPLYSLRQIQQKLNLHFAHDMWLQPEILKTDISHRGQNLHLFFLFHSLNSTSLTLPHLTPGWAALLHFKHTSWPHSHLAVLLKRPVLVTYRRHPGFGHHLMFGFKSALIFCRNWMYFEYISLEPNYRICSSSKAWLQPAIMHGIFITLPSVMFAWRCSSMHPLQNLWSQFKPKKFFSGTSS